LTDPLIYARAVHFAATILAAGTVFFQVLVAEPAFAAAADDAVPAMERLRCRWSWLVRFSLAIALLSAAVWLVLLAAAIYGAPIAKVWANGGVWTVVTATRFGQVWSARLGLAVVLALALPLLMPAAARPRWSFVPVILAAGLLIAPAWTGHAGATPGLGGQLHVVVDALHVLAAGGWIGGLPPLAMLLAAARWPKEPGWTNVVTAAIRRFSLLGMASVGVLLATGIINTWFEVGSFADLIETAYGRLIVLKLGLFAVMVALAAVNRFHLTPRLAAVGAVRQLQRNSLAEAALGFAAVLVVGFLGTMAPASHAHLHPAYGAVAAEAAFTHIHGEQGIAEVTIMPGRAGSARATIRLWNEDFGPLEAQAVTLTLTAPTTLSKPTTRFAWQTRDGAWQVDGIELPQPGIWMITVGAVLGPHKRLALTAPIVIEPGP
jgi:putative copper resistance protein D